MAHAAVPPKAPDVKPQDGMGVCWGWVTVNPAPRNPEKTSFRPDNVSSNGSMCCAHPFEVNIVIVGGGAFSPSSAGFSAARPQHTPTPSRPPKTKLHC